MKYFILTNLTVNINPNFNHTNVRRNIHLKMDWLIDWLLDYLRFYVPLKNISLIWRRHHCCEGLQNLGLCSTLKAFEHGGIFFVPHLLRHGASVFLVSSEGSPIQSSITTHKGIWRTYSNPDPHGSVKIETGWINTTFLKMKI
jgi:hypothetical protein